MKSRFKKILSGFDKTKVCVIGDLILDCFIWGKVRRISPEAPVPVVEVERDSYVPGGAANVANNIVALGGKVFVAGVVGKDQEGKLLLDQMTERGINISGIGKDQARHTTLKTRVVAHQQQVVRIDREVIRPTSSRDVDNMKRMLMQNSKKIQAILVEDYGKGVLTQEFLSWLIDFSKCHRLLIGVDPKKGHLLNYRGIHFATPNLEEAAYFAGIELMGAEKDSEIDKIGSILLNKWECNAVLITLGSKGMCLFEKGQKPYRIPTRAREVYDVSGAGDTVIGTFVTSLLSGANFKEAAQLANLAAGIVVGKLGTAVVSQVEMGEELENVIW